MTDPQHPGDRARAYAAWARSGADRSFAPVLAAVVELLPPAPGLVLDVGCGEGRVGRELIDRGYEVTGVDGDETMVRLAAERYPAVFADAGALPFVDASFDMVITVHALMEIVDLDAAFDEVARVVRPGGPLVAVVEHPFVSGRRVRSYSEVAPYAWDMRHDGDDLRLGGIHRPLGHYVGALERAGLRLDSLREVAAGGFDPLSLALRATSAGAACARRGAA